MPAAVKICEISFTGGPLDGLRRRIPRPPRTVADIIAIPVNPNLFLAIEGKRRESKLPASSIAVYEPSLDGVAVCYQFLGAATVEQFHMEGWTG